jgi:hypothetical protein
MGKQPGGRPPYSNIVVLTKMESCDVWSLESAIRLGSRIELGHLTLS